MREQKEVRDAVSFATVISTQLWLPVQFSTVRCALMRTHFFVLSRNQLLPSCVPGFAKEIIVSSLWLNAEDTWCCQYLNVKMSAHVPVSSCTSGGWISFTCIIGLLVQCRNSPVSRVRLKPVELQECKDGKLNTLVIVPADYVDCIFIVVLHKHTHLYGWQDFKMSVIWYIMQL